MGKQNSMLISTNSTYCSNTFASSKMRLLVLLTLGLVMGLALGMPFEEEKVKKRELVEDLLQLLEAREAEDVKEEAYELSKRGCKNGDNLAIGGESRGEENHALCCSKLCKNVGSENYAVCTCAPEE